MGIRAWLKAGSEAERRLEAKFQADADKARKRLAQLEREREQELRAGHHCPHWYAQEHDRAADELDYALGRGPYKE